MRGVELIKEVTILWCSTQIYMGNQISNSNAQFITTQFSDFIPLGWRLYLPPGRRLHRADTTGTVYHTIPCVGGDQLQEHFQQADRVPHDDRQSLFYRFESGRNYKSQENSFLQCVFQRWKCGGDNYTNWQADYLRPQEAPRRQLGLLPQGRRRQEQLQQRVKFYLFLYHAASLN